MKIKFLIIVYLAVSMALFAQSGDRTAYTLEECINAAIQNNPELKASRLEESVSEVNFKQSKNALLPSLNGSYNIGVANGRNIDPYTNAYVDERLTFSNAGLGLDATVFNGFRLINSWKQAKLNLEAAAMDAEAAKQELILRVTLTYLQVLSLHDVVSLAGAQLKTTEGQLERLKTFYESETGNPAEYHDLQGQRAADASRLAESKNDLESAILTLNTLVNADAEITAAPLSAKPEPEKYPYTEEAVFAEALNVFPSLKSNELDLAAAEKGVAVARSQFSPHISLFGNLNTNFSSSAMRYNAKGSSVIETGDFISVNDQYYQVMSNQTDYAGSKIPYGDQFNNNLNSSFGLSVTIPIFNGFRAKYAVTLQKIYREEAQTELDQTRLDLKVAIGKAYSDMQTTFERMQLLQNQVDAYRESFRINEIRFNTGVSNSVDYLISKNNLDNAEINLSNVRYVYALRVKVLEYYRVGL